MPRVARLKPPPAAHLRTRSGRANRSCSHTLRSAIANCGGRRDRGHGLLQPSYLGLRRPGVRSACPVVQSLEWLRSKVETRTCSTSLSLWSAALVA